MWRPRVKTVWKFGYHVQTWDREGKGMSENNDVLCARAASGAESKR